MTNSLTPTSRSSTKTTVPDFIGMFKIEQETRGHLTVRAIGSGIQNVLFADVRTAEDARRCVCSVRAEHPDYGGLHGAGSSITSPNAVHDSAIGRPAPRPPRERTGGGCGDSAYVASGDGRRFHQPRSDPDRSGASRQVRGRTGFVDPAGRQESCGRKGTEQVPHVIRCRDAGGEELDQVGAMLPRPHHLSRRQHARHR